MFDPQTINAIDFTLYSLGALAIVHAISIFSGSILKWVFLGEAVTGFKTWADAEMLHATTIPTLPVHSHPVTA